MSAGKNAQSHFLLILGNDVLSLDLPGCLVDGEVDSTGLSSKMIGTTSSLISEYSLINLIAVSKLCQGFCLLLLALA